MPAELVADLDQKLRAITREYCQLRVQHRHAKRPGSRVYKMLSDYGPVETLNRLIDNKTDSDPTIGLGFLKAIDRLDLSAEAVALDPRFRCLMTEEILHRARKNLGDSWAEPVGVSQATLDGTGERTPVIQPLTDAERRRLTLQLAEQLRQDCDEAQRIGCGRQTGFRQMLAEHGPIEACRRVIMVARPLPGFLNLYEHNKLELTAEARILSGPWRVLFESAVLEKAKYWLIKYNRPDLAV